MIATVSGPTALCWSVLMAGMQDAAPAPAPVATHSVLDYIQSGGVIGVVLIGLSVAALTLIIVCFFKLRMSSWAPPSVVAGLGTLLRDHDVEGAKRYCADPLHECFITGVIGIALHRCARSTFGFLELRSALEEAGQVETDRQHKPLDFIAIIAALGPMLGLLGTVFGLIGAFGNLAQLEGAARSKELAGHMSLALVNTAEGLMVAIPCTAFYAYFKRRVDRLASDAAMLIEELAVPLEGKGAAPAAPARVAKPAPRPAAGAGAGAS